MPAQILIIVASFWVGACIGSFANVAFYRIPRKMSVSNPKRSFCPKCKIQIPWHDNIPVVGWIMLGGKCRSCKSGISIKYPLVEFAFAVVGGAIGFLCVWGGF